ncbi:MAG: bifunctional glutamate N-acetyltransferase/amino-acid acetyltransferase ArgJ [Chlamydiae bacterium]|nr:bifunctional glutamate N-acetyltransferase/amino-acid acetyltransferase ArgJ [Chlamydiota bacterium]MBI3265804.1 bifunctional glutamate N-acetyltransferase/amino-acid acetyltransferase ArgJ [Chlamydiota bacterium]
MQYLKELSHGSICFPKGFLAAGMNCGIKMSKKDLALIFSEVPARVTGTFTTNSFAAAPVRWCREIVKKGMARAIIVNSGNANACTGEGGFRDTRKMAKTVAQALNLHQEEVLVSSTGVIGKRLPMETIEMGIQKISKLLSKKGEMDASAAILTTDTFGKTAAVEFSIGKKRVRMGVVAKGAGMIEPHMATLLCYITTDAAIELSALKHALKETVDRSFNCLTVDGDMSTNDSVILMANGMAGNKEILLGSEGYEIFLEALSFVTLKLAKMIAWDGEGATKLVQVRVTGAHTDEEAKKGALAIANSNLFKVSLYSQDPNWGRLMAALGSAKISGIVSEKISVKFNGRFFVKKGKSSGIKLGEARKVMRAKQLDIHVDLGLEKGHAVVWTCDLTHKYVDINM